jgi:hypothetical protein
MATGTSLGRKLAVIYNLETGSRKLAGNKIIYFLDARDARTTALATIGTAAGFSIF